MRVKVIARALCVDRWSMTLLVGLVSMSSQQSAASSREAALDKAIPAAMTRASIPGAIVGVWQDGREPYVRAFGVRDTATGQPMTTDLYMRIGSTTKTFTVTAILMLVDQGKIGLDDPVDRYVKGVPGGNQITLRQLAAMRSGLYDYSEDTKLQMIENPGRQWTPRELLEIAFRHPPVFPPGSKFDYNNTNTVLLGQVVENVSGESIGSFIEKTILKPEGLTHTVYPVGAEVSSPHAHGYFKMPDGKVVDATDWNPSWGGAAGQMISTLDDMRVWARDLATGKLISPAMKLEREKFLPAPEEGDAASPKCSARSMVPAYKLKNKSAGSAARSKTQSGRPAGCEPLRPVQCRWLPLKYPAGRE